MTVQPIVAALQQALDTSHVALGDGEKPKAASTRYIVGWFEAGSVTDRTMASRDGFSAVATFHCYGQTPDAARFAYAALTTAVLGLFGQTIDGRRLLMPEQLTSLPLQRDDDLNPPLFDAICEWRFRTTPV